MGSLEINTESIKVITYEYVLNSFDNDSTLINAQWPSISFLRQRFLMDHANFNEDNQRTRYLTPFNWVNLIKGLCRAEPIRYPLLWKIGFEPINKHWFCLSQNLVNDSGTSSSRTRKIKINNRITRITIFWGGGNVPLEGIVKDNYFPFSSWLC